MYSTNSAPSQDTGCHHEGLANILMDSLRQTLIITIISMYESRSRRPNKFQQRAIAEDMRKGEKEDLCVCDVQGRHGLHVELCCVLVSHVLGIVRAVKVLTRQAALGASHVPPNDEVGAP